MGKITRHAETTCSQLKVQIANTELEIELFCNALFINTLQKNTFKNYLLPIVFHCCFRSKNGSNGQMKNVMDLVEQTVHNLLYSLRKTDK